MNDKNKNNSACLEAPVPRALAQRRAQLGFLEGNVALLRTARARPENRYEHRLSRAKVKAFPKSLQRRGLSLLTQDQYNLNTCNKYNINILK